GHENSGGKDGPNAGRENCDRVAGDALGRIENRETGERGEESIGEGRGVKRANGKAAEDFENGGDQQRVDGREPGGGACWLAKEAAEALGSGGGLGDGADFVFGRGC